METWAKIIKTADGCATLVVSRHVVAIDTRDDAPDACTITLVDGRTISVDASAEKTASAFGIHIAKEGVPFDL